MLFVFVSIESFYCEFEFMDINIGVLNKSIILKCIMENFFLEFFIIEGFDLDLCSK